MNKRILSFVLGLALCLATVQDISAVTKKDAQNQKSQAEKNLNSINNDIENIAEDKEAIESEIEAIDAELVDLLLTVELINGDIGNKQVEITNAQAAYDEARGKEEDQLNAMKRRIKFMYEKGDTSYLELIVNSQSLSELVNKNDYVSKLYSFDRQLLSNYQNTKEEVLRLKGELETELEELEELQQECTAQSQILQETIDKKRAEIEDFDNQLSAAKSKAAEYKSQIKEQTAIIKQIEAEEAEAARRKAEEEKKKAEEAKKKAEEAKKLEEEKKKSEENSGENSEANSNESAEADNNSEEAEVKESKEEEKVSEVNNDPGNSSKGQEIANFALQFVGNPYVSGGTSLTDGCDCSGFTSSVYSNFGISLPRTSYSQSTAGREVSYSSAQPGDVIYYGGHVGIYIGNGQIVHASTPKTGIKVTNALYRSIITVRRFV
ncbi:MAG: C40 family peptidase [Lachnospiraceae bacterium]|nr:C40 family peptidase [Lachnospiraceae bacterium]